MKSQWVNDLTCFSAEHDVQHHAPGGGSPPPSTQLEASSAGRTCYACHGAPKQESDLRLDTAALMIQGGALGAAIVPGDPQNGSLLLERVAATDASERMPPEHEGEPLSAEQIELFRRWIAAGCPDSQRRAAASRSAPALVLPTSREAGGPDRQRLNVVGESDRCIHRPAAPATCPLPQPEADKRIWLRRVSFDLIGLPPTPEELDAFVADHSAEAYEKVVMRLLDSPQYGQRWGRHWMDVWRYSDWWGLGAEVRNSQKHIWHWRDWIIESLNDDSGYDQMLREMLAADELYPNDLDKLSHGFLGAAIFHLQSHHLARRDDRAYWRRPCWG